MDIKPYIAPMIDFWASIEPFSYVLLGFALVAFLGCIFCLIFDALDAYTPTILLMIAFSFSMISVGFTSVSMQEKYAEHYNNAISELKENLADDGFKIVSGTPNLKPNTQSSMLLSYEGKNFDCTLFSPEDVKENIVFSCGEAKMNLSQIKEQR